jgi:hypothetical protein
MSLEESMPTADKPLPGLPAQRFKYQQSTGNFLFDGQLVQIGYSGAPGYTNNSRFEGLKNCGPIPRGSYTFGVVYRNHPIVGPWAIQLIPDVSNNMLNRSDFMIHGDNISKPGTASKGCIVLGYPARRLVIDHPHDRLLVY